MAYSFTGLRFTMTLPFIYIIIPGFTSGIYFNFESKDSWVLLMIPVRYGAQNCCEKSTEVNQSRSRIFYGIVEKKGFIYINMNLNQWKTENPQKTFFLILSAFFNFFSILYMLISCQSDYFTINTFVLTVVPDCFSVFFDRYFLKQRKRLIFK